MSNFRKIVLSFLVVISFFSCKFDQEIEVTNSYFTESEIEISCGEQKRVVFKVEPEDATNVNVKYYLSETSENLVEITDTSKDGCIIIGKKHGSCVLIADCNGRISYLQIKVNGSLEVTPYIMTTYPVYELLEGNKTTFNASLYGGNGEDNFLFEFSNGNDEVIEIKSTANNCVIEAKQSGSARITISHPKSKYPASVMVYVTKEGVKPVYITTSQNTIQMGYNEGTKQCSVQLVGSSKNDLSAFSFNIKEGYEVVNLISNNNNVSITPKSLGVALIEVTHPECEIPLEIQVIVVNTNTDPYIDSDNNFLVFENFSSRIVTCSVIGRDDRSDNYNFTFENTNENVCKVEQVNNSFYIEPLQDGKSKIIVRNSVCALPYEIYIVVQNVNEVIENSYITTGQNVIMMEVGQSTELKMLLTGGNESDKNNFEWTIDDGSIIDVVSSFGKVNYLQSRSSIAENLSFNAIVEAKKVGIATISISNPKSFDIATVKVKVYPKGTLNTDKIELSGESLVKVVKGKTVSYSVVQKNGVSINSLNWSVLDEQIASVEGNGFSCVISGKESGVTTLKASNEDMVDDYEVTLMCGTEEELKDNIVLYCDNRYPSVYKGSNTYFEIGYNGVDVGEFSCSIQDESIAKVRMSENVLIVNALSSGETEITVRSENSLNTLVLFLTVYDEVTIDKPYYFNYEKFVGVVIGETKQIEVDLVGALEDDVSDIRWEVEDNSIVSIVGNGESCRIEGKSLGETVIKASSFKSNKDAQIIVYTAETAEELKEKIVLKAEKNNFLSYVGEDIYVKLYVSDENNNREKINWSVDDISKVRIDDNYDEAYIRCLKSGNAVITVSCEGVSSKIYISIKEQEEKNVARIEVANILEIVKGNNLVINADVLNMDESQIQGIEWSIEDSNVATIKGNGKSCYISALEEGYTKILVKQKDLGIEKQIQLISYSSYEQIGSSVVIGLDKTYYSVQKGEYLDLLLNFGENECSEEVENGIIWNVDDENIVQVVANGRKASFLGVNEGVVNLTVSGEGIINTLKVKLVVTGKDERIFISCEKLIGLVVGDKKTLEVGLIDNTGKIINSGLEDFSFEIENEGIINCISNENVFNLECIGEGTTNLIIKHPLCSDVKVLVYTALTKEELERYYPLTTNKTHYLLGIGESATLSVLTIDDSKVDGIKWSCDNASICSYSGGGNSLVVMGKKSGTCVFTASHSDSSTDVKFTVNVTDFDESLANVSLLTESIIDVKVGNSYVTQIQTSLDQDKIQSLVWSVSDDSIVEIDGSGTNCSIKGLKKGNCEITVKYNSTIYRTIYCKVLENENEKYYAMNQDKRYYILSANESISLTPYFKNEICSINNMLYEDLYKNNVIEFENNGGKLKVIGKNEGIAAIKVSNSQAENEYILYFEVHPELNGNYEDSVTGYLSMTKTIYVFDSEDTVTEHKLYVTLIGIDESEYGSINWKSDNDCVTLISNRNECSLFVNKVGTSVISISSPYSSNVLNIKVIVVENKNEVYPYIELTEDNIELSCNEVKELGIEVKNIENFDIRKLKFSLTDDVCEYSLNSNGKLEIKGKKGGQGILTIGYDDIYVDDVNIVISVKEVSGQVVYLTTDVNYSLLVSGSYTTLKCRLEGYEELDSSKFIWEIESEIPDESGKKVANISGSGLSVVVNGINTGTSRIKVNHEKSKFPLYFTVKVVNSDDYKPIYIKTETNVINMTENERNTVSVELVNGNESENNLFSWSTSTPDIISLSSANNMCSVQALTSGMGRITVSHPSSIGQSMDIVVVVNPKIEENSLHITTDSSVIEMKPTDAYKQVNVTLVGGKPEQNVLFNWSILSFESTIKNADGTSNSVVELIGSQDSCMIKPIREGNAIIRVTNSATTHYLDIKVIVQLYSNLNFTQSSLTIKAFESGYVEVNCPTGKNVIYESSNEQVAIVSGTNKMCIIEGVGKGTCVIKAHTTDSSSVDEIIVKVEENKDVVTNYIKLDINTLMLNTLDDLSGQRVKASLHGSGIQNGDENDFQWKIASGNLDVVSFVGNTGTVASGEEVIIKPIGQGEVSINVTHPKSKNGKTLYVSVEQNSATMQLSSTYEVLEREDIKGFSCTLGGVANTELENISWSISDTSVIDFVGSNKGSSCTIRAIDYGEATITVQYGQLQKYINIYVQEKVSITLPNASSKIGIGQSAVMYEVFVTPKSYYDRVQLMSSNSTCAKVEKVLDNDEQKCYIKVIPTQIEGSTTITASLEKMSASMTVNVTGDVGIGIEKYEVYDGNNIVETVKNPSSIVASKNSSKVRVYYKTDPIGIMPDNEEKVYTFDDAAISGKIFYKNSNPFFELKFGNNEEEYYFDLIPKNNGYGGLILKNYEVEGIEILVPICFTLDFNGDLSITRTGKSSFDSVNGIINIANDTGVDISYSNNSMKYRMKIDYDSNLGSVFYINEQPQKIIITGRKSGGSSKIQSSEYIGIITVSIYYPKYYGVDGVYVKSFIVNKEIWR